jgi:hypothetical protein
MRSSPVARLEGPIPNEQPGGADTIALFAQSMTFRFCTCYRFWGRHFLMCMVVHSLSQLLT